MPLGLAQVAWVGAKVNLGLGWVSSSRPNNILVTPIRYSDLPNSSSSYSH